MGNDFQALKDQADLAAYICQRTGMATTNAGSDTLNLDSCPFCGGHECFRITHSKQRFHCYQCAPGDNDGDIYDFIQRLDQCDKGQALQLLAEYQGHELTKPQGPTRTPEEEQAHQAHLGIFDQAAAYYHDSLMGDSRALNYQRRVRCHADKTLVSLMVGHTDGLLHAYLAAKGFSDDQLIASGLVKLKEGRKQDFFVPGLFIYPHRDRKGQVAGFTIKDQRKQYKYRLPGEYWLHGGALFFNMPAFAGKEVFLVEGENDLLTVHGRGGMANVSAVNGQVSKNQLDYLKSWAPGKTLYLCFDNDPAGKKYTDSVCQALRDACLPPTLARIAQSNIDEEAPIPVDAATVRLVRFDNEVKDVDEYLKGQSQPEEALKALMLGAERYYPPLQELKSWYSAIVNKHERLKFDYDTFGKICFEWFQARGKFFIDGEDCHLYFNNWIYKIGTNTPFKALLYDQTGINPASNGARLIIQNIESQAYLRGDHTSVPGWIFTNFKESTVYFNLCGEYNNLLKIGPGKIEVVPNGTNAERVLLRSSPKMKPLRYLHDADVKKGMVSLKTHIFDNLACDLADKYFVVCMIFNVVMLQYVKARGITKFSGTKGCGKTSAASMLSALIYGEDCVTTGSAASDFSEAAISPLTISDNLESDAVKGGKRDFLLTAATGITRQKRKAGSDSDNVYERSCTMLLVTSIEPFAEPELIERTNEILFDKRFHNPDFRESIAVESDLKESRDLIWSSIFKIVAHDILPKIDEKKADALKTIRTEYPSHSKARLNELYAMLFIILQEVVKYIHQTKDPIAENEAKWILHTWIRDQNQRAFATESETNRILYNLEALLNEYEIRPDGFEREYGVNVDADRDGHELKKVEFTATTNTFYRSFDILAKERGITNPFRSAAQLGARIKDSVDLLQKAGWCFEYQAKKVNGNRLHRLTRTFR
ncbi:MAG: toprim domain-containing protein [Desulfobulbus sp.]